ncbi:glycosyltransferase [Empedobacter falsenii]
MKKRILLISGEAWRNESNGGNVLTNLFESFTDDYEFAQIYTNPALPSNNICFNYFHLSEAEMIRSVVKKRSFGKILVQEQLKAKVKTTDVLTNNKFRFIKKFFLNTAYFVQDLLWRSSKWKSLELERFIKEYNPDIIFAPMYYGIHLHRLDRYVAELTNKKLVSYVSDDHLTYKHFSLSPFFWINRVILRANVKKTSKYYSLLYTMTQEQLNEYQPVLKVPMKVLKKAGDFEIKPVYNYSKEKPITLFYGGNLIYNRYKTLARLAEVIKQLNQEKLNFQLIIATQTPITDKINQLLNDGKNCIIVGKLNSSQMQDYYQSSDIVLHVESFDLQQKLVTRLSFSTKIIDLLSTGRCVIAICWKESSPYKYLKSEDAAICINNLNSIKSELEKLKENPKLLEEYANKAWDCGQRNHQKKNVSAIFRNDLESLIV